MRLVTLEFSGATITAVENETGPQGLVEVTLTGVESNAIAFTDRPARLSAEWSVTQVLDVIESAFAADDPVNANLSARLPDSLQSVGIVLVVGPSTWDEENSSLTLVAYPQRVAAADLPDTLRRGYLFIDNAQVQGSDSCTAVGGQCGGYPECCSAYCPQGTCKAPLPPGSPCNANTPNMCGITNEETGTYNCCGCESDNVNGTTCVCMTGLGNCWD